MIILAIRTDSPLTELVLLNDNIELARDEWESGRTLASNLLSHIVAACEQAETDIGAIDGVICFEGPGSFTGLRIGITVGNTLAYSNNIPIVGSTGEDWLALGIAQLLANGGLKQLMPKYGSDANITM